jgi:hypothetical protein
VCVAGFSDSGSSVLAFLGGGLLLWLCAGGVLFARVRGA